MVKASYICRYISEHPSTWESDLTEKKIRISHGEDGRVIFNYGIGADFFDPLVQEARGIIIDANTLDVLCWPFRKFGNWNEPYADPIDWESARVQEKIDGSLIKLYYYNGEWVWATRQTIDARYANVSGSDRTFLSVIHSAVNYHDILFDRLDPENTYIFELVSPETQVIIPYPEARLYHIGTRNNKTGLETEEDIGIVKPEMYSGGKTLMYWRQRAHDTGQGAGDLKHEGYVVVDKNYHRVKIKTPEYLSAHRVSANGLLTKERALQIIVQNDEETLEIINANPFNAAKILYYRWQIAELIYRVSNYIAYVRGYYEEIGHDRKALAQAIKGDLLAYYGFMALGNNKAAEELIREEIKCKWASFVRQIKDYPGESM